MLTPIETTLPDAGDGLDTQSRAADTTAFTASPPEGRQSFSNIRTRFSSAKISRSKTFTADPGVPSAGAALPQADSPHDEFHETNTPAYQPRLISRQFSLPTALLKLMDITENSITSKLARAKKGELEELGGDAAMDADADVRALDRFDRGLPSADGYYQHTKRQEKLKQYFETSESEVVSNYRRILDPYESCRSERERARQDDHLDWIQKIRELSGVPFSWRDDYLVAQKELERNGRMPL